MRYAALLLAAALAAPAQAQMHGTHTAAGCFAMGGPAPTMTARGLLSIQQFPGPPNFESVEKGDRPEKVFVLTLPAPICIDDGGQFADPAKRFMHIQISYREHALFELLERAVGSTVTVSGDAWPAMSGHYHEPMAIFAATVTDASGRSRSR